MARTWYQISNGQAPWADESAGSQTDTWTFNNGIEAQSSRQSYSTYGKGVSSSTYQSYTQEYTGHPYSPSTYGGDTQTNSGYADNTPFSGINSSQGGYTLTAINTALNYINNNWSVSSYTRELSGRTLNGSSYQTIANTSTSITSYTSSTLLTTASVITGYASGSFESWYNATTSVSSDSTYIISTALTSSTNSATSSAASETVTYVSTTTDSASFSRAGLTYLSRLGSSWIAQTTSYVPSYQYLIPVISADTNEFLRMQNATDSTGIYGLDDLLEASFTQTTLNAASFTSVVSAGYWTGNTPTRTVTSYKITYSTATVTTSTGSVIPLTRQRFDGWVGGTATSSYNAFGATTTTYSMLVGETATTSRTVTADRSLIGYQSLVLTSFFAETIAGINSLGDSAAYAIVKTYAVPQWFTYASWEGQIGETVTKYRSPAAVFAYEGYGELALTRLNRSGGYQSPSHLGSTGSQGASISAASSFYIGSNNLGIGSPADLLTPFLTAGSTAQTSNSVYSFSLGATDCSVTAVRTESSVSSVGTATSSYTTGTTASFTASFSLGGVADVFQSSNLVSALSDVAIAGGPHAWTGGQQHATLSGGYGWRYTIGDSAGTTSYKETRTASVATAALGSSIIAAETFRAGLASPLLQAGLPSVLTFAY